MDLRAHVAIWSALAFMACAAVVAAGFQSGPSLWTEETAAWVQAVGSVAAIVAAIWIDRGSQRRARDERWEARKIAIRQRGMAIAMAQSAFKLSAKLAAEMPLSPSPQPFPDKGHQALLIARECLEYTLSHPSDLSEDMVTALVTCRRIVARVETSILNGVLIATEAAREAFAQQLTAQEEAIKHYRSLVPDWKVLRLAAHHTNP